MALEEQVIPISFAGGVDTKTDPKQVSATKLLALSNGFFQSPQSIRKVPGYAALTNSGSTISAGAGVASLSDQLVLLDGSNLYGYSQGLPGFLVPGGIATNPYVPLDLSVSPVYQSGATNQVYATSAYHSGTGFILYLWSNGDGGQLLYSIYDTNSKSFPVSAFTWGTSGQFSFPQVVTLGGYFVMVAYDSSNTIYYNAVNTASPRSATGSVSLATTATIFDIASFNSRLYLAYADSGTGALKLKYMDTSFTQSSSTTVGAETAGRVTIFGDTSNEAWVGYQKTTQIKAVVYNANLTSQVTAPTVLGTTTTATNNITGIMSTTDSNRGLFFYDYHTGGHVTLQMVSLRGGVVTGPTQFVASDRTFLASKPFAYNSSTYVLVSYFSNLQPTYFLLKLSDTAAMVVVGKTTGNNVGTVGSHATTQGQLASAVTLGTGRYQIAINPASFGIVAAGVINSVPGVESLVLNFTNTIVGASSATPISVDAARTLHLNGGILTSFDGVQTAEHGFFLFPEDVALSFGGGGSIAQGTYEYVVTWRWRDVNGQLYESAPSAAVTASTTDTAGGSKTITVTIPQLPLTNRIASQIYAIVWRTTSNGTIFYALNIISALTVDPTVATMTYTDAAPDSLITGNTQLYTTGGVVENTATPPVAFMSTFKDRLLLVPADSRNSLWYSQEIIPAIGSTPGTPALFSDTLVQNIDSRGGDLTAAVQLDDKLILFKYSTLFYMVGDGPSSTGSNNDFSAAQLVSSDVGCVNPLSVVVTPEGIFFDSVKGRCFLDRGLNVSYIGAAVEAYNAYSIVDARLVAKYNQVRIMLSNGTVLAYDYLMRQWSTLSNYSGVSACMVNNLYTFAASSGVVYQETPAAFSYNGTNIGLSLTTGWIKLAGIVGFQRVRRLAVLGTYESAHNLVVSIYYDYSAVATQTVTITARSSVPYEYLINLVQQKCEAIQVVISDSNGAGESMRLSGISLEVGVKKGFNKLPQNTQVYG